MRVICFAAAIFCLGQSTAWAQKAIEVEAWGEASMKFEREKAREEAINIGLKRCIEKAMGLSLKNEFTAEQRETTKGGQTSFYSDVRDRITKDSKGFVETYEVVKERVDSGHLKVLIRAKVFENKLKAEASRLIDLMRKIGDPKLVVVLQEVVELPSGKRRVRRKSALLAALEKELLTRGFKLRAANKARKLARKNPEAFADWMEDDEATVKAGKGAGADMLVVGQVVFKDSGPLKDVGAFENMKGMHRVTIEAEVRGVHVGSGETVTQTPVRMTTMGSDLDRAIHRAMRGRGNNLVNRVFDSLLGDLKALFERMAMAQETASNSAP